MKNPNYAHSVKARLLNMADGSNKKYQQLVVRYFHERLLFRLSRSIYREHFILKGGALLYAYEEFTPRPTLDLDFMGSCIDNSKERILKAFQEILEIKYTEDGVHFLPETMTAEDITVEKRYPGVRIGVVGLLDTYQQKVTLDVGFGDVIVPHPVELDYPTLFVHMEVPHVVTYSLETVVAEKFQTMIERGRYNSRMKDYFDLYRIFKAHTFDDAELLAAISATFENRNTVYIENQDFFSMDFMSDPMLNQQWRNYGKKKNLQLPDFKNVMSFIAPILHPYWEKLKDAKSGLIHEPGEGDTDVHKS
jgi:predicted nucleotidyltransferase component of viral defense system